jgi:hypothetical protein
MRRRSRSRRRGDGAALAGGVALAVASAAALGGLAYVYATQPAPVARDANLCGPGVPPAVTAVLLDVSDPLPAAARKEVATTLGDLVAELPAEGLLDVRALDPATPGGRPLATLCNPGDGAGSSALTANPALMRDRWAKRFHAPIEAALSRGLDGTAAPSSPIMSTIQAIALDRFAGKRLADARKRLVVVSDMVENAPGYRQRADNLSFARFAALPAHRDLRADLAGADVTLLYVQRANGFDTGRHVAFWADWFRDSGGRLAEARKLQGLAR